jgi:DNA replication protein DnaC
MIHHTIEKLRHLRLAGMAKALEGQLSQPDIDTLPFDERLALLIDHEDIERQNAALARRLQRARLRQVACIEDIDLRTPRGLDRSLIRELASCDWLRGHHNLLITGPTGVGKSWIACALGNKAAREGFTVLYGRLARLLDDLATARLDGGYARMLTRLSRIAVLILDDWAMIRLTEAQRRDLMDVIDDRHQRASTILATQIPIERWHEMIGDPTYADAILDRLVHNAHRIEMSGESMRKKHARKPETTPVDNK